MRKSSEPVDTGIVARRKRLTRIVVIIVLLIALPITIYLLRQSQILRSGATSVTMTFADPANPNTPITSTSNPNVVVKMVYGDTGSTQPTATPTPAANPTPTTGAGNPTNTPVPGNPTITVDPSSFHLGDQITLTWSNLPNNCICFIEVVFPQTTVGGIFTGNGSFQVSLPNDTSGSCVLQPLSANLAGYSPTSGSCSFTLSQSRFDNLAWSYLDSYTQPVTANVVLHNYIGSATIGTFGTVTLLP